MYKDVQVESLIPEKVLAAKSLSKQHGFDYSCSDEVGKLLQVLTASIKTGSVAEIGTGFGVSTAWIFSRLSKDVSLISIDHDLFKINAVRELFNDSSVQLMHGDWVEILKNGPFQFIFADGGKAKEADPTILIDSLEIGGMILIDDLTPIEYWPEEWKGQKDIVRESWLNHPKLNAIELLVTPRNAVIIATKIED